VPEVADLRFSAIVRHRLHSGNTVHKTRGTELIG